MTLLENRITNIRKERLLIRETLHYVTDSVAKQWVILLCITSSIVLQSCWLYMYMTSADRPMYAARCSISASVLPIQTVSIVYILTYEVVRMHAASIIHAYSFPVSLQFYMKAMLFLQTFSEQIYRTSHTHCC
jgi:hypothetical protein